MPIIDVEWFGCNIVLGGEHAGEQSGKGSILLQGGGQLLSLLEQVAAAGSVQHVDVVGRVGTDTHWLGAQQQQQRVYYVDHQQHYERD